jgi:hypothetical protein
VENITLIYKKTLKVCVVRGPKADRIILKNVRGEKFSSDYSIGCEMGVLEGF